MDRLAEIEDAKMLIREELRECSLLFGAPSNDDDALIDAAVTYLTATSWATLSHAPFDLIQHKQLRIVCDALTLLCPELINRAHFLRLSGELDVLESQMIMFFVENPHLLV